MAGIYPRAGVPATEAANAVDVATTGCDTEGENFYANGRCPQRFDPVQMNAVISEILNAVTCVLGGALEYDCSRLDNLCRALQLITVVPSTSGTATTDSFGNPIRIGDEILTFGDGRTLNVTDDTDTFTFAAVTTGGGTDSFGNDYDNGAVLLTLASGETLVMTQDTFTTATAAPSNGADSFGVPYETGDPLIVVPQGQTVAVPAIVDVTDISFDAATNEVVVTESNGDEHRAAIPATVDITGLTFNPANGQLRVTESNGDTHNVTITQTTIATATAPGTDSSGNPIATGDDVLTLPDGTSYNLQNCCSSIDPAGAGGTDDYGNAIAPGDDILTLGDGRRYNLAAAGSSDGVLTGATFNAGNNEITFTRSNGLPNLVVDLDDLQDTSDGVLTGVTYNAGNNVVTFSRSNGLSNLTIDLDALDVDTFVTGATYDENTGNLTITRNNGQANIIVNIDPATTLVAAGGGTDVFGDPITAGDNILELPNGDQINLSACCTGDVADGFATVATAGAGGTDSFGNTIATGDEVITFQSGQTLVVSQGGDAPPNANQTTNGTVEIASSPEILSGAVTGDTGAQLAINPERMYNVGRYTGAIDASSGGSGDKLWFKNSDAGEMQWLNIDRLCETCGVEDTRIDPPPAGTGGAAAWVFHACGAGTWPSGPTPNGYWHVTYDEPSDGSNVVPGINQAGGQPLAGGQAGFMGTATPGNAFDLTAGGGGETDGCVSGWWVALPE